MKSEILKFLKPSRTKIITLVAVIILAALTMYFVIGAALGCAMSWGCDTLSFGTFIFNALALVLVVPAYFTIIAPQLIFSDFDLPTSVMIGIMIAVEVIYLYALSCVITFFVNRYIRKRRGGVDDTEKKNPSWFKRNTNLVILAALAIIIVFDGLAFPRRLGYVLELFNGASLYIEKFSTALKIMVLSVFEIWYLRFLFVRRKKIVWNAAFLAVMYLVVFVLLILNIVMLVFGF